MPKQKEELFINVADPSLVRRNILESSQQIVEAMKSYEKYKKIKAEKLKKIEELKTILANVRENAAQLRKCLPGTKAIKEQKEERVPNITVLELEQLNAEIRKLEAELNVK